MKFKEIKKKKIQKDKVMRNKLINFKKNNHLYLIIKNKIDHIIKVCQIFLM